MSLIGNPLKIGDGPAAVIGDKNRKMPLFAICKWEGAGSRKIRKSENLPRYKLGITLTDDKGY